MLFIVIEGLDGSGKTTAARLLQERFALAGMPCLPTFEPTRSDIGELIHGVLSRKIEGMDNTTMALLFAADRFHHLQSEIVPALAHSHVICDRYYYSSMAYQGFDADSIEKVVTYNAAAIELRRPDIVFFLDVTPEESVRRIAARGEELSIFETLPKLSHMQQRFSVAIERMRKSDNIVEIDTSIKNAEQVAAQMWDCIVKLLGT